MELAIAIAVIGTIASIVGYLLTHPTPKAHGRDA